MFAFFYPTHLLFVLLVALAVFGSKRLIEVSRTTSVRATIASRSSRKRSKICLPLLLLPRGTTT